ncbi:MAG TPA: DUF115 domain-containing protein [Phycisphaerae bacterium]|nr:DUF115 domain-containing protein [Phycisphaerae bacterium]HNU46288.1 DUF115 domain-containing protein [Phycisphaerae bacterium]
MPESAEVTTSAAPAVGNAMFVHNLRALWAVDPELALRVDAVADDERLPVEPTRSGAWTVQLPTPAGQSVYLHSRHDPELEAQRLVAKVPLEEKFCFVVSGFGLGYHVRALFRRLRGDAFILCTEPSVRLLATAFACVDLAEVIASKRLVILVDHDKARLHERLHAYNTLIMLGARFVAHPPSMQVAGEAQQAFQRLIAEYVTYARMSLLTLVSNAQITCRNIAMNLRTYVSTPPIDVLKDRFAGVPGILISAGPSLARNLDLLAEAKGRAVLIAVQTALKPLMQRGIVPDFVTSLDFHEMSRKFLEGVEGLEAVHLVAEPKATWHVLDHYPGPISLLHSGWATLLLGEELGNRGGLRAGATVAHLALYVAQYMGCNPIIMVGQDLAFTGHVFYVPGVEIHRAWRGELNRFQTIEMKEWERIARNRPILRTVPAAAGGTVYTDELLLTYLEQFEKDIAGMPQTVINATEGGAAIRGTQPMTLREALDRCAREPLDPARFAYRAQTRWHDDSRRVPAAGQLRERLSELDEMSKLCTEFMDLLHELEGLITDPARFNRRLVRVDELRSKVQQSTRAYHIINSATQMIELRRFSADRRLAADEVDEPARAKRQIARDLQFVSGVRDGAAQVREILNNALARLEAAEVSACR